MAKISQKLFAAFPSNITQGAVPRQRFYASACPYLILQIKSCSICIQRPVCMQCAVGTCGGSRAAAVGFTACGSTRGGPSVCCRLRGGSDAGEVHGGRNAVFGTGCNCYRAGAGHVYPAARHLSDSFIAGSPDQAFGSHIVSLLIGDADLRSVAFCYFGFCGGQGQLLRTAPDTNLGGGRQPVGGGHGNGGIAYGHRREQAVSVHSNDGFIGAGKGQLAGEMLRRHSICQGSRAICQVQGSVLGGQRFDGDDDRHRAAGAQFAHGGSNGGFAFGHASDNTVLVHRGDIFIAADIDHFRLGVLRRFSIVSIRGLCRSRFAGGQHQRRFRQLDTNQLRPAASGQHKGGGQYSTE